MHAIAKEPDQLGKKQMVQAARKESLSQLLTQIRLVIVDEPNTSVEKCAQLQ